MKLTRDIAVWLFCWACYWTYHLTAPRLPWGWELKLLPFAGMYAYSDTWADFRECVQWNADGRPRQASPPPSGAAE